MGNLRFVWKIESAIGYRIQLFSLLSHLAFELKKNVFERGVPVFRHLSRDDFSCSPSWRYASMLSQRWHEQITTCRKTVAMTVQPSLVMFFVKCLKRSLSIVAIKLTLIPMSACLTGPIDIEMSAPHLHNYYGSGIWLHLTSSPFKAVLYTIKNKWSRG